MLKNITKDPTRFFEILPKDWQTSILLEWETVEKDSKVYVLEQNQEICAGGIIFSTTLLEMENYKEEALQWFSNNYLYIGYLWVPEKKRNKNFGSSWMNQILQINPQQHYWLTTDEKPLRLFYEKIGFSYLKTFYFNGLEEDLFIYDNKL